MWDKTRCLDPQITKITGHCLSLQLAEMPTNSPENPWRVAPEEGDRHDLRSTHLVLSIDPKGCEDVDDTLSIRELKNGHLELGVHIADVTHFVKPNSYTDMEAKARSVRSKASMLPGVYITMGGGILSKYISGTIPNF